MFYLKMKKLLIMNLLLFFSKYYLISSQIVELSENESICSNKTSVKNPEICYSLKTKDPNNICAFYHVLRVDLLTSKIADYQKCSEISFTKSSVEQLKESVDDVIDDYNSYVNINFGVAKKGANVCSEYSYKNSNRTVEEAYNFCTNAFVNFDGNKCCLVGVEFQDLLDDKVFREIRCVEAQNEDEADLFIKYIIEHIKKESYMDLKTFYLQCYDSKQVTYDK